MEEELRVPWEDVFESIEPEPLAAGTIGQVHRARLEAGERVVVKVQRPGAARGDPARPRAARALRREGGGPRALRDLIDIPAVVEHLSESLRRELDFRQEAANLERMRDVLEPYDRLAVPACTPSSRRARLLVMDEIVGRRAPRGAGRRRSAARRRGSCSRRTTGRCCATASSTPTRIPATCSGGTGASTSSTSAWSASSTTSARADAPAPARVLARGRGFLAEVLLMLGERADSTSTA